MGIHYMAMFKPIFCLAAEKTEAKARKNKIIFSCCSCYVWFRRKSAKAKAFLQQNHRFTQLFGNQHNVKHNIQILQSLSNPIVFLHSRHPTKLSSQSSYTAEKMRAVTQLSVIKKASIQPNLR